MYVPPHFDSRSQQKRPRNITQKHRRQLVLEKPEHTETRQRPERAPDRYGEDMRLLDVYKTQHCLCYFHGENRK